MRLNYYLNDIRSFYCNRVSLENIGSFQVLGLNGEVGSSFSGETVLVTTDNLVSDIEDDDDIIETQFVVEEGFAGGEMVFD